MRYETHKRIASPSFRKEGKERRIQSSSFLLPSSRKRRGFTLIEMIVATLLLAIAVVGALAAYASATQSSSAAERLHTVALLAQRRLTEVELQSDTLSGGEQQGDFGEEFPEYRWRQVVEPTEYQNLYKVTLTVQWGPENGPRQRDFTTFIRNDQNQVPEENSTTDTTGTGANGGGNGGNQPTP